MSDYHLDFGIAEHLVGLIDGEGHFGIAKRNPKKPTTTYCCVFAMKLREDDAPMLERLAEIVGLGSITYVGATPDPMRKNKPTAMWRISRKHECLQLVEIIEEHPLWSKKARDFDVWKQAVRSWCERDKNDSWHFIATCHDILRRERQYKGPGQVRTGVNGFAGRPLTTRALGQMVSAPDSSRSGDFSSVRPRTAGRIRGGSKLANANHARHKL